MSEYKVVTLKTLALEIMQSPLVYEIDVATDFDVDHQVDDIVSEFEVSCFYSMRKIYMADTVLIACVYSGGTSGKAFLFDIMMDTWGMGERELNEMQEDLALELKNYLEVYEDNLVALEIKE
jgi:hypothetical protein